jgi:hypothetical protein
MGQFDFPNALNQVGSWATTEIRVNSKVYPGLTGFKGPDIDTPIENVYGQGRVPVGWSIGNQEPITGSMTLLEDSYNSLLLDVTGGDPNLDMTNYPLTIVELIQPAEATNYSAKVITHSNVRVSKVTTPDRSQGAGMYEVQLDLQFTKIPDVQITPKDSAEESL